MLFETTSWLRIVTRQRPRSVALTATLVVMAGAVSPVPIIAQGHPLPTIFAEPADSIHVERYQFPSFCVAMINRTKIRGAWQQLYDTLPYRSALPMPAAAVAEARACLARFPAGTTELKWLGSIRQLALIAGDDSAHTIAVRRQVAAAKVEYREYLLAGVFDELLGRPPAHQSLAQYYINHAEEMVGAKGALNVIGAGNIALGQHALNMMDIAFADSVLAVGIDASRRWFESLTDPSQDLQILQTQREMRGTITHRRLRAVRGDAPRTESAAEGVRDPRIAALAAMLFDVMGDPLVGKPLPHVEPAAQLPSGASRLVDSGKVTLLAMVDPGCGSNCMSTVSMFRRLARQFPALDIKLVATAYGHIRDYAPAPLATQAEQIRAYYLDSLGIGTAVIVDAPTSTPLVAPDRRRLYGKNNVSELIRSPAKNEVYQPGIPMTFTPWMVLVDQRGTVVLQESVYFDVEPILGVMIDRLLSAHK